MPHARTNIGFTNKSIQENDNACSDKNILVDDIVSLGGKIHTTVLLYKYVASGHSYIYYSQMVVGGLPNLLQYYIREAFL